MHRKHKENQKRRENNKKVVEKKKEKEVRGEENQRNPAKRLLHTSGEIANHVESKKHAVLEKQARPHSQIPLWQQNNLHSNKN